MSCTTITSIKKIEMALFMISTSSIAGSEEFQAFIA